MFRSSTQLKNWTFKSEAELSNLRIRANEAYIEEFSAKLNLNKHEQTKYFLTADEEWKLLRYYDIKLKEFCENFTDPRDTRIKIPLSVTATAQHYFKRFYLHNSVMDYHPRDILVTSVYLACKIEEFYVTINEFICNIEGDQLKTAQMIVHNELQITEELRFNLIVHLPYRAVEGLLIDVKTKYPELDNPERLRQNIEEFLEKVHLTDAILLYGPSEIALAAVTNAVSKVKESLDTYVTDILLKHHQQHLSHLVSNVRKTKKMVKTYKFSLSETERNSIEEKLEQCRNPLNNPSSEEFIGQFFDDDDD